MIRQKIKQSERETSRLAATQFTKKTNKTKERFRLNELNPYIVRPLQRFDEVTRMLEHVLVFCSLKCKGFLPENILPYFSTLALETHLDPIFLLVFFSVTLNAREERKRNCFKDKIFTWILMFRVLSIFRLNFPTPKVNRKSFERRQFPAHFFRRRF